MGFEFRVEAHRCSTMNPPFHPFCCGSRPVFLILGLGEAQDAMASPSPRWLAGEPSRRQGHAVYRSRRRIDETQFDGAGQISFSIPGKR